MVTGSGGSGEPVAVGYLRSPSSDSVRLDLAADRLAECGARQGFAVETVYRDCGVDEARSGFHELLERLRGSDTQAVIVPSPAHLPHWPDVRFWMKGLLDAAGVQLVVMPELAVGVATVEHLPGDAPKESR